MKKLYMFLMLSQIFVIRLGGEQINDSKKNVQIHLGFMVNNICFVQGIQAAAVDSRSVYNGIDIDANIHVRRIPWYGVSMGLGVKRISVTYTYAFRHRINFFPEPDNFFKMMDGRLIRRVGNGGYDKEMRIQTSILKDKIHLGVGYFKYRFYICEEGDWSIEKDHPLGPFVNFDQFYKGISLEFQHKFGLTSKFFMENQFDFSPWVKGAIRFWDMSHADVYRKSTLGIGGRVSTYFSYQYGPAIYSLGVFGRMLECSDAKHTNRSFGLTGKVDFVF